MNWIIYLTLFGNLENKMIRFLRSNLLTRALTYFQGEKYSSYFILVAAVVLVFAQVLSFSILSWDDVFHICKNPNYFSADRSLFNFWVTDYLGLYAPLSYSIWGAIVALGRMIFGENSECSDWSGLFHGLNLLVHIVNTILVYEVLRIVGKSEIRKYAIFGALLFGLHPLQVESVAWISGARDLLSFMFGISGVLLSMKGKLKFANIFLILGCLAKATGVVFPLIVLALFLNQRKLENAIKYIPSIIISICFGILAKALQPDAALKFVSPLWQRPLIFLHNLGFYFYKLLLPTNLVPDYTRSIASLTSDATLFWPIGVLILLFRLKIAQGFLSIGLVALAILPVSGLIPFGFEELSTVAEAGFRI